VSGVGQTEVVELEWSIGVAVFAIKGYGYAALNWSDGVMDDEWLI
jgi:hypothetical protein